MNNEQFNVIVILHTANLQKKNTFETDLRLRTYLTTPHQQLFIVNCSLLIVRLSLERR